MPDILKEESSILEYLSSLTLLCVEDNKTTQIIYDSIFEDLVKEVIFADDGADGYQKYMDNKIDIIITDYEMNHDTGGVMHFNLSFAQALFEKNNAWLQSVLARPFDGKTVVVTHHAPSLKSIHSDYKSNEWNPCFVSDLEKLMDGVGFWVHGHTHSSFDYQIGKTRVVCNPRGYPNDLDGWENKEFNPSNVIFI